MSGLAGLLIALAARRAAVPLERAAADTRSAQETVLARMMRKNRDTEYGREHGFAEVRNLTDYARRVPVVDCEDRRDRIDRVGRGETNVPHAENPIRVAQTSGTTGKSKLIPVTPTCRKAGGLTTWLHYARRDHPQMFNGPILTIVSPAIEG